jgi:hypothetical protein
MYCPHCGSQIPEESKYCFKCGNAINLLPQTKSPFSDKPPRFISDLGVASDQPQQKGFFGKIKSGARVYFRLLDEARDSTRCAGTAIIQILQYQNNGLFKIYPIIYHKFVEVKEDDFRQSKNDPNFWGYFHYTNEPVLVDGELYYAKVHYKSKDGVELDGEELKNSRI